MNLDMSRSPAALRERKEVMVGNLYRTSHKTLLLIVSIYSERCITPSAAALRINGEGKIIGSTSGGIHWFERMPLVGVVTLPEVLAVDWLEPPQ
jgi:hypothetical protein